jgi:hypothetical protein
MTKKKVKETNKCDYCGRDSDISTGWHLKLDQEINGETVYLDFCSNSCVADYIEKTMSAMFLELNQFEKRITKLKRKIK